MKTLRTTTLLPAGLLSALLLSTSAALALDKSEDNRASLWGEWQPMASGYAARRRQPAKIGEALPKRRLAEVQQRPGKQLRLQARSAQQTGTAEPALRSIASTGSNRVSATAASNKINYFLDSAWLYTSGRGLYEASIADLATHMGRPSDWVRNSAAQGKLAISRGGVDATTADQAVPWYFDTTTDSILFAARGYDSFHTEDDAYRIQLGYANSPLSLPMSISDGGEDAGEGQASAFRDTLHFEEEPDMMFLTWVVADEPEADYWFWDYLYGGSKDTLTLPLTIPNPADSGTVELQVRLRGFTDTDVADEHYVEAYMNGQYVGEVIFDGLTAGQLTASFDQSLLDADGNNTLELQVVYADGTNPGQFLDDIIVSYDRLPVAQDNSLWLHSAKGGIQSVAGFSSDDIVVIEAPTGEAMLRQDVQVTATGNGDWQVSFEAGTGKEFLVSARGAADSGRLARGYSAKLRAPDISANYLIIAPREFTDTATSLAYYRHATVGQTRIVWLDLIYQQFNAGRAEPVALSRFMQYVVSQWQISPSVVMLLGKGSLDYKDRMGYSDGFLPVALTSTPFSLAVSDSRLLGFEDDPPFAIGRLPIVNDAEGVAYVAKLAAHESGSSAGGARALLVADNPDKGGDFPANNDITATRLIEELDFASAEQLVHPEDDVSGELALSDTWNRELVIYDGHGSIAQAGDARENFMLASGVSGLTNSVLPIFSALTCAVGDHSYPATRSLAGALVLNPDGGAITAMVPSGLSLDTQAQLINEAFTDGLYLDGSSVGDALRDAKALSAGDVQAFVSRIYGIIGEPSVLAR